MTFGTSDQTTKEVLEAKVKVLYEATFLVDRFQHKALLSMY